MYSYSDRTLTHDGQRVHRHTVTASTILAHSVMQTHYLCKVCNACKVLIQNVCYW